LSKQSETSIAKLIFIPAVITLAITILRLVGELQHWSTALFNPAAGGGGAAVGITWLAPIFGIYFAWTLINAGNYPDTSAGRVILFAVLGMVAMIGGLALAFGAGPNLNSPLRIIGGLLLIVIATTMQFSPWRKLFKTLLAYAIAARIPVMILMLIAIKGNWGTHYDVAPPNFPEMDWFRKYILIGFLPQMFLWIPFTVLTGALTAGIIALFLRRKRTTPAEA
jgi:hypothetical protein